MRETVTKETFTQRRKARKGEGILSLRALRLCVSLLSLLSAQACLRLGVRQRVAAFESGVVPPHSHVQVSPVAGMLMALTWGLFYNRLSREYCFLVLVLGKCFKGFLLASVAAVFLAVALQADATEGAYFLGYGPLQQGRAGAGVASPRDASWMLLNPASIVDLDRRVDLGIDITHSHVTLAPRGLMGNSLTRHMTDRQYSFAPSLGATWPTKKGVLGLGLYVPSGVGADFPQSRNIISRFLHGNADRRMEFQHARLVLAYARTLRNGWALGIAVNGSLSRFRTDSLTLGLAPTRGGNRWDDAFGAGFCVGAYRRWRKWALGACYHSRQWSQRFDDYSDLLRSSLDLPQSVQVGLAHQLTRSLEIVADYKFIDWTSVKLMGETVLADGLGWEDQHIAKLGLEWRPNARWTLRSGLSHGNAAIGKRHVFINGLSSAGVIEDHASVGVSYAMSERSECHVTYVRALRGTRTTSRTGDLFDVLGAGTKIGAGHDGIALGYTYKF